MRASCCDDRCEEYNLIQFYQKSGVSSSHTQSTFESNSLSHGFARSRGDNTILVKAQISCLFSYNICKLVNNLIYILYPTEILQPPCRA